MNVLMVQRPLICQKTRQI